MNPEIVFPLIMIAVLLAVLICAVRALRSGKQTVVVAFYAFAIACSLFSTVYWTAYDLLRPEERMPFAANEICEMALFLLLASSLRAAFPRRIPLGKAALPAALFAAANTALWIAWTGEWMQDILTGLSLGWLLCVLIACLLDSGAMTRGEWLVLAAAAVLVVGTQTGTLAFPAAAPALDLSCSVLLFAADAWLILKAVRLLRRGDDSRRGLCLAFASFAWSTTAMYMSGGWAYNAALSLAVLGYPLMLLAIRKEAAE